MWKAACAFRKGALLSAVALPLLANVAWAQSDDTAVRAQRSAYATAIKCFVANGVARGDAMDAGKPERAASFEAKARQSFDTAMKLGDRLGYEGQRVNEDFGLAQAKELPAMVRDQRYFLKIAATCKAIGLM